MEALPSQVVTDASEISLLQLLHIPMAPPLQSHIKPPSPDMSIIEMRKL
jgi:hypothetical protein